MSDFNEVAAAWRGRTAYAAKTERIVRYLTAGLFASSIVYAATTIWQAAHTTTTVIVVPIQALAPTMLQPPAPD
jgi:hypothetical protein